ncbi:hypothetical protein V6N13_123534 [Hibiscus sabdariffa]
MSLELVKCVPKPKTRAKSVAGLAFWASFIGLLCYFTYLDQGAGLPRQSLLGWTEPVRPGIPNRPGEGRWSMVLDGAGMVSWVDMGKVPGALRWEVNDSVGGVDGGEGCTRVAVLDEGLWV